MSAIWLKLHCLKGFLIVIKFGTVLENSIEKQYTKRNLYTTSIMTNFFTHVIMSITRKEKAEPMRSQKGKDMTTINRFEHLNSERYYEAALYSKREWGLMLMRSSGIMQIRGNCDNRCKCS